MQNIGTKDARHLALRIYNSEKMEVEIGSSQKIAKYSSSRKLRSIQCSTGQSSTL